MLLRIRGQCWWKGGPENELEFMGKMKLGPLSIGKGQVKTYKFFLLHEEVRNTLIY